MTELLINRMGQIEVAASFVEASRNRDSAAFGTGVTRAPEFGPFVVCPKEDPVEWYGGICMTALPVSWDAFSISILVGATDISGDLALTANVLDGTPLPDPVVFEDVQLLATPANTIELELVPETTSIQYSEDMAGAPISWARIGDPAEGDSVSATLMVVGFTLRRL